MQKSVTRIQSHIAVNISANNGRVKMCGIQTILTFLQYLPCHVYIS